MRNHKKELIKTTAQVIEEMERDLTFGAFARHIEEQIADSHKYEKLKEDERELT